MNTSNNTVFISGGSAGIGFEIAKSFSEKGNKVIINGRSQKRLDQAIGKLNNAFGIQGDLSLENDRIRIAKALKQQHPELNIIINNAGVAYTYSLSQTGNAYENSANEINTNYLAIIHFTDLLLPHLLERDYSAIVNITSIVGLLPAAGVPTYSASKAALHFYTQSLRKSLAETKIGVFEVMPPLVNTEFSASIGGANGIPPRDVADELLEALKNNQFDVPVGQSKTVYAMLQQAITKLSK